MDFKNIKNDVPLVPKQRFTVRNTVSAKVKEFKPLVTFARLKDENLSEPFVHYTARTDSMRLVRPTFKKQFQTRAGFNEGDKKLLDKISDPGAKALALATMERVFKLDGVFKDDNTKSTPFKMLSIDQQNAAKSYFSRIANVCRVNSKL